MVGSCERERLLEVWDRVVPDTCERERFEEVWDRVVTVTWEGEGREEVWDRVVLTDTCEREGLGEVWDRAVGLSEEWRHVVSVGTSVNDVTREPRTLVAAVRTSTSWVMLWPCSPRDKDETVDIGSCKHGRFASSVLTMVAGRLLTELG